jgi:CheY-like chemotaxis protein
MKPTSGRTPSPASTRDAHVLVIDDDASVAAALSDAFEVEFVSHPRLALEAFQAGRRYDVIFCDVAWLRRSGVELVDDIERMAPGQLARFVFLTAAWDTDRLAAKVAHNLILGKPFDPSAVKSLVRRRSHLTEV